uniref:Plastid lipid-associated protein/fibrillin conserved domain-containing protein n=1 Tax=Medicago truncatula TaxID=3880 RepID=B7FHU1_MEDTR|nr:unknown [Medicago truncatula]
MAVSVSVSISASHPCISTITNCSIPSSSSWKVSTSRITWQKRGVCKAMVQVQTGAPAAYAKEVERLSAKESPLLAFKDAGGFEGLVSGKTTEYQRIDVNERITGLERLNPTPRPTTSPFLEGRWNFEWFGPGSPGLFAARMIFENFPSSLANLSKMDALIKDGNAKITANTLFLNSVESRIILSTKLTVEGPLRMKEEYVERDYCVSNSLGRQSTRSA